MPGTPDDILRALADPERLAIAGHLARSNATAGDLAENIRAPLARVRKHLNRLSAAGVIRLGDDRRTYRLDAQTLRWAAEQSDLHPTPALLWRRRPRTRNRSCARSSATAA
jgi:DNA-binding transcriptional ArsR family regulator